MGRFRTIVVLGFLGALAGCAGKKHSIDGLQPLANHTEWHTDLDPAAAIDAVAKSVVPFGFAGEKSFWGGTQPPKPSGDYFDQGFAVANAHGEEIHARVLWLKENSTQIIIETALAKDRHAFVMQKVKDAVKERENQGRK